MRTEPEVVNDRSSNRSDSSPSSSSSSATRRDIVLCCDGTNNTLTAGRADTHVLRMYEHLHRHPAPGRVLFYDPGVGAPAGAPATDPGDWLARTGGRISGLASGRGIYANITDAYLFVVRHYQCADDRIWLFGFSRGAFTVRCVAGMINLFGIVDTPHEVMLPTLVQVYFSLPEEVRLDRRHPLRSRVRSLMRRLAIAGGAAPPGRSKLAEQIQRDFSEGPGRREAWVHFIGVWDTVESVGLPGPLSRSNPTTATIHKKRFRHVRHAVALDEHRWTFEPRLYEVPGDVADPHEGQTLKQRWFPGGHRDVGGGYSPERAGLADATLRWMMAEAVDCGLAVPALRQVSVRATAHDELWDTPWWALAGMCLRNLQPLTEDGAPIEVIAGPSAGPPLVSVWTRRRRRAPLVVALLLAAICLERSGAGLDGHGWRTLWSPGAWWPEANTAIAFASEQFHGPWNGSLGLLLNHGTAPVFWAMCWDFAFIACWSYLLARVASRAFAWLAGMRQPGMPLPAWRFLGFMPLLAVAADSVENLSTVAAFAARGIGFGEWMEFLLLAICSLAALLKLLGLAACLPLLLVRLWVAMPWVRRA